MNPISKYLDEIVSYGGEAFTRAEVIADMQRIGVSQPCIDRWLQGHELAARLRALRERLAVRLFLSQSHTP